MDEWKPHCPACCKLLDGPLILSRCNHVFHRDCLQAEDAPCPKCQQVDAGKHSLELFGLGLGDAGKTPGTSNLSPGAREAASEVLLLKRQVEEQQRAAEELRARLEDAKDITEKQRVKLQEVEKDRAKRKQAYDKLIAELDKHKTKKDVLYEQACRSREQSITADYVEKLQKSKDKGADALAFLTTMVSFATDPGTLLTEMSRLRDHHRGRVAKLQRDNVKASPLEARVRREIAEANRAIAEHTRKLQRGDPLNKAQLSESTELQPSAKRPRVTAEP